MASLSIIIHHYTGGHLQIILSQHHSDCQHSVPICAINKMMSIQCKPNVKCLQIPRYPGEVRSCLLSRISVASRVCCPSGGASAAHRNLGWRVDNNHHQQPIPPSSVSTSTAPANIYNWYRAHNDNVHLCLYNTSGGNITFWSRKTEQHYSPARMQPCYDRATLLLFDTMPDGGDL